MIVSLRPPTLAECQQVRAWRNAPEVLPTLRTQTPLTAQEQWNFYHTVVINPSAPHRYYAIEMLHTFLGLGGLTHLDRQPGQGEISLIIRPQSRRLGWGTDAVAALLQEAFGPLKLTSVIGECYLTNPAMQFWATQIHGVGYKVHHSGKTARALVWEWRNK